MAMYLRQALEELGTQEDPPMHNHPQDHHPEDFDGMPLCLACEWFLNEVSRLQKKINETREIVNTRYEDIQVFESGYQDGDTEHNHLIDGDVYVTCSGCLENARVYQQINAGSLTRSAT